MDEGLPPPPARSGSLESWERAIDAPAGLPRRPVAITIAGVLLLVAGAFASLAGALILLTGDQATIEGVGAGASTAAVMLTAALAAAEIASGLLVLRCAPIGRVVGIAVAALGIVGGLTAIGSPQGVVTIAIFGFVMFVLVTKADAFRPPRDR
ncbi:MAG: hypothetical protein OEV60_03085 [Actinomycetota bacterium]|nr:hypothetical protein [Actinomycetota bacterium]MDH5223183.1 hypothetical protein [Actinomycetota bacterium]MDH5312777.1 hypothetical protein [Actinomycetota bacterium]